VTIASELGRPQRTAVAAGVVLLCAVGLSVATFIWVEIGSQMLLPSVLVWTGWGVYPGFASFLAIRARSELTVTAVAVLAPALIQAPFNEIGQSTMSNFLIPLSIAGGIFVGMWAASALMRRPGLGRTLIGFVAGGALGYLVAIVLIAPAVLLITTGGPAF
jgi:hypothetical protein